MSRHDTKIIWPAHLADAPILLLDYDGVLHPFPCRKEQEFIHAEKLAGFLRFNPMAVVVTSNRREGASLDNLRAMVGPLASFIVGATPVLPWPTGELIQQPNERERECRVFADLNGLRGRPMVALDDTLFIWKTKSAVIPCDPAKGLGVEQLVALKTWLKEPFFPFDWEDTPSTLETLISDTHRIW